MHGLSVEIAPIFADRTIMFEQRSSGVTQHAVGFYDFPSASQNAERYLKKAREQNPHLVKNIFDMSGFPRWHLMRTCNLKNKDIGDIYYVGFSVGNEVSFDYQFNGFAHIFCDGASIMKQNKTENRLLYRFRDLLDILDSLGNTPLVKEDIFGNKPQSNKVSGGFGIVDDCLGTILNILYHHDEGIYTQAEAILKKKGYTLHTIFDNSVHLDNLV